MGTGFIQLWSGLPAPGKPCLGHGVSSDMGVGAVSLGLSQLETTEVTGNSCLGVYMRAHADMMLIQLVTHVFMGAETHSKP